MHRLIGLCLAALLMAAVSGCGPTPKQIESKAPEINSNQELKQRLSYMAESGFTGSALAGLQDGIKKLGKEDLNEDLAELEKAQDPETVKKIAKRMVDKL